MNCNICMSHTEAPPRAYTKSRVRTFTNQCSSISKRSSFQLFIPGNSATLTCALLSKQLIDYDHSRLGQVYASTVPGGVQQAQRQAKASRIFTPDISTFGVRARAIRTLHRLWRVAGAGACFIHFLRRWSSERSVRSLPGVTVSAVCVV